MNLLRLYAVCAALLVLSSPAAAADISGLPVTQITLADEHGTPWPHPELLLPLVGFAPGDAFSRKVVRDGITFLYLKGLFTDIQVDAFPDGKGVRLLYTLLPMTIVEAVGVTGNHAVSTDAIKAALPRLEGQELREDRLPDLRDRVLALYRTEGYDAAEVGIAARPAKEPHRVILTVSIQEHEPTVIEAITFRGNTVFQDKELLRVMKSRPGGPVKNSLLLDKDWDAIVEKYAEAGYPAARRGQVDISFRDGKAAVSIQIIEGRKVQVQFSGNHAFSDKELKGLLLIWSEHDSSRAIIESSVDKIKTAYQEAGYRNVDVAMKSIETKETLGLMFTISEGPRVTIKKIVITGASFMSPEQLKKELGLQEPGWFSSQPFREDLLANDTEYLRDRLFDAGFLASVVKSRVDVAADGREASITIDIVEGPRTTIGSIAFKGNSALTSAELQARSGLKPGAPLSERLIEEDRSRILSAYASKGYLYAHVDVERSREGNSVALVFRIAEDHQVRVGRIILRGNERTADHVILREVNIHPGDPYDYGAVLLGQQHIYRLGFFSLVRFEPLNTGEKEYTRDMLLTVEERPAGSVELGLGYGNLDRVRASVEVSYRNLWGQAQYLGLRLAASDIAEQAVLDFREPWFLNQRLTAGVRLAWYNEKRLNADTREIYYQTRKTEIATGLSRAYDNGLKPSLIYQYENVDNYNVSPAATISPDDSGRVRVSSITPSLILDLRDDPFNPRKGSLHGFAVKEAMKILGSEADFTKFTAQTSWYFPMTSQSVLALSGRVGVAVPHLVTKTTSTIPPTIPLHERFYLGGVTTLRGYLQDSVGPQAIAPDGTVTPQGGESMVLFNAEVRLNQTEGFGLVFFYDTGNVWADRSIVLTDLRAAYGMGIRYNTPVGPLRLDYGQKVHRRPGESPGELHFNIGNMF
jgi:outer membrane protein insertion porin family